MLITVHPVFSPVVQHQHFQPQGNTYSGRLEASAGRQLGRRAPPCSIWRAALRRQGNWGRPRGSSIRMRSEIKQIANGPTALGAGSPFRGAPLGGQPALATARERSRTAIWSDVEWIEASVKTIDLPGKIIVGRR